MKKILVFLAMLLSLSISTYSQDYERIGREKNEVMKEFKGFKITTMNDKNHTSMMLVNVRGNVIIYTFDERGYCDHTSVVTKDFQTAKSFEYYYLTKYIHLNGNTREEKGDVTYSVFLNCDNNYVYAFRHKY